uniref:Disease resistance protein At1g50180 n=1 Tax=Elaeis guineensis var. tenera TaxID=51953 RepID=A0A8N4IGJ5_ELAGV|nr:putative disease resistance protein At1g50180 [Elaeis guineensis]
MAMILEAFVGKLLDKLSEFIWGEIFIMRDVQDELKQLQRRIERLSGYLESAEHKRHEDRTINNWVVELKDVMYDAEDIIERCMIEGRILLENHPSTLAMMYGKKMYGRICLDMPLKMQHLPARL